VALEHGRVAARAMLGKRGAVAEIVPYFWSDLADWAKLEYVGIETAGDPVVRGSLEDGDFIAFYLADDGRLVGAATVGRRVELTHARRLIATRATPDRDVLADDDGDLSEL
jgi:3-phenylpropionate/trans-cinnamate dioxygenase ferredoxin reductase subunit